MKPEDKKKLFTKFMWRCFIILLIAFSALYMSQATGYYEYEQHRNVVLTEEKIKEFESDVKDGKNIDITNYVETNEVDYSNSVSDFGMDISNTINNFVTDGLENIFNFLGKMVDK